MATLYIVATPIGNLEDITLRALRTLRESDAIICEDTRVTSKLLAHYKIKKSLISYHQHSSVRRIDDIVARLAKGENLVLVSDAGTPGIHDPGNFLISQILDQLSDVSIIPIPGPSALATLASVAGIHMDTFLFAGFLPRKKGRKTAIEKILQAETPVILYESTHRIIKTLQELSDYAVKQNILLRVVVGRELTKKFETIYRGDMEEVIKQILEGSTKGEFVFIIEKHT